uniref:Uncharacterized protein n=1 Tax=Plectus sambesii TaxID=2011161 RepID=A0A914WT17_9BILA
SKMKTVVYACLGVLSCLEPNEVWLAALSGIFVLILAAFCGLTLLRKSIAARSSVSPYSRYESGIEQNGTNSIDLRT